MASALAETISGLHWWNWVFIILDAVASLVALWAIGGWYLTVIIANMASSIFQFVAALEDEPAGGSTAGAVMA